MAHLDATVDEPRDLEHAPVEQAAEHPRAGLVQQIGGTDHHGTLGASGLHDQHDTIDHGRERRRVGGLEHGRAVDEDVVEAARAALAPIVAKVWRHCAEHDTKGRTVTLKVKYADFQQITRSRTLLQTQADLLQCSVEVYPSPHATALGVAAFAMIGAGLPAGAASFTPSAVVEPSIGADEAAERLAVWQSVADATMDR